MIRLLESVSDGELHFQSFNNECDLPDYAVLSHTWSPRNKEELTYQDVAEGDLCKIRNNPGFAKLRFCANKAQADGVRFFWVDTCCIDKTNSAELNEAIMSMFRWYQNAARCYVYLSDVSFEAPDGKVQEFRAVWEPLVRRSRWFTRGWTLQEMIAPKTVQFFSREGLLLGDRGSLVQLVHEITQVPIAALCGAPLSSFTVEDRMSWASSRQTGRPEDIAYCLLGIFNVTVIPAYGEGRDRAFNRLRDEVEKSSLRNKLNIQEAPPREHFSPYDSPSAKRRKPNKEQSRDRKTFMNVIKSLKFDQIETRRLTIKNAHADTCSWILNDSQYHEWMTDDKLHDHHGFLWIKGKPGSGKSTLMKFVYNSIRRRTGECVLLSFFFNARGHDLEKSVTGAYRTLLAQLLEQRPELAEIVFETLDIQGPNWRRDFLWEIEMLKEVFRNVIQSFGGLPIICLIDALDECDEDEVRDMISFLEDICQDDGPQSTRVRICLASRHYPHISLRKGLNVMLDGKKQHEVDIYKFIVAELKIGHGEFEEEMRQEILRKASGVFIWVVLVIRILNKAYDRGHTDALRQKLAEIPDDIYQLFRNILKRDSQDRATLILCIQWILFARRPLSLLELYNGIQCGLNSLPHLTRSVKPEEMDRFILNASKGLTEVTNSGHLQLEKRSIQFIHESVRDFFLKENGLAEIMPDLADNFTGQSHERLSQCCLTYIRHYISSSANNDSTMLARKPLEALPSEAQCFPLLTYVVDNGLYHADKAAEHDILQDVYLQTFPFQEWVALTILFPKHTRRRYRKLDVSTLYIFGEMCLPNLVRSHKDRKLFLEEEPVEQYAAPLFAAIANNGVDTVRAFLETLTEKRSDDHLTKLLRKALQKPMWERNPYEISLSQQTRGESLTVLMSSVSEALLEFMVEAKAVPEGLGPSACSIAAQRSQERVLLALIRNGYDINFKPIDGSTPFYAAVMNENMAIIQILLNNDVNVHAEGGSYGTALQAACAVANEQIVRLLLGLSADVNANLGLYGTALQIACAKGTTRIPNLLLTRGANVNASSGFYGPALQMACRTGSDSLAKLLLERGAEVNAKGGPGGTALQAACRIGHERTIRLLLDKDADVNAVYKACPTALQAACIHRDFEHIVKLLLAKGANVNVCRQDEYYSTALLNACTFGHEQTVKLLLDHGADMNVTGSGIYKDTPALAVAVSHRHKHIVKLLIERGANVNFSGIFSHSALQASIDNEDEQMAERLRVIDTGE